LIRVIKRIDRFHELRTRAPQVAADITKKHVEGGVELLKGIMPRDSGDMIESTEAVPVERGFGKGSYAIRIGVDYWIYPDRGTVYIEGQHFVPRAVESIRSGLHMDFSRFESFLK
jgi:hypothetical protein